MVIVDIFDLVDVVEYLAIRASIRFTSFIGFSEACSKISSILLAVWQVFLDRRVRIAGYMIGEKELKTNMEDRL